MVAKKSAARRDQSWYDSLPQGDKSRDNGTFSRAKFVRGELSVQEKEHVKAQQYEWQDITEHFVLLVEQGYKVTASQDKYNSAFAVWITPQETDNPNHGFILSARGPTLLAAFAVAFYKHFTKFDGVWPKDDVPTKRDAWG